MKGALRLFLALLLVLSSPGTGSYLLFAQENEYDKDSKQFKPVAGKVDVSPKATVSVAPKAADAAPSIKAAEQKIRADKRLSEAQKDQASEFLGRYNAALTHDDKNTQEVLDGVVKDLSNPDKDPGLALASMFDKLAESSRRAESGGTYVQYMGKSGNTTKVRVASSLHGKTLYMQTGVEIDSRTQLKTITRPDPDDPSKPEQIEAIIREEKKGAATEQRVLYNRRVHQLFSNLKKLYYDQCGLVRRINNGGSIIKNTTCVEPAGFKDEKLTEKTRMDLELFYENNRRKFPPDVLKYLERLDMLKAAGKLGELNDYRELERIQRSAMFFYNQNQLETYQRAVIMEITSYMSAATGVQPKSARGTDQLDLNARELSSFQSLLDQFHKGNMEGYTGLLAKLGWSDLDENDRKVLAPKVMSLAAEAFADVAYAYEAQQRLLNPDLKLSNAERDATIEEAGQWLRLASIQIQSFQLQTQAMQLIKLSQGKLRGIGIQASDTQMIAEAERLAKTAREQYFPQLQAANTEAKLMALRQTIATFYSTFRDTVDSYLYTSALKERVRLLAGKADQIMQLYLSREFDKANADPAYAAKFSALEKVKAGAYKHFLDNLPANVAALKARLEAFRGKLHGWDKGATPDVQKGLAGIEGEFKSIAKEILGSADIPTPIQVQKDAQKMGVRHGRLFSATGEFTSNMRLFDMLNELEIYVKKYASNEWVSTKNDTFWTQLASFQWVNYAYDKVTFGGREAAADAMLRNSGLLGETFDCSKAFEMLKGNKERREAIQKALREGNYKEAQRLAATIDPEGAKRMKRQAELDKLDEDKADLLDLDGFLNKQQNNDAATMALGSVVGAFNQLGTLIKGYAAATAITDMVITTVLTAVGGPLISFASRGAVALVNTGRFIKPVSTLENVAQAGRVARMLNFAARAFNIPGAVLEYMGKVALNSGRTFRKVLALPEAKSAGQAVAQIALGSTWNNAFRSAVHSTLMMGGISAGMQGIHYGMHSETSQYKNANDAMIQGFVQGASFGAKAGMLNYLSPVPAAAFTGRMGGFMRTVAESPGPLNFLTQKVAQITPGLSKGAIAEAGALGALSQITLNSSRTWYAAGKMMVWGGGIIDGTFKYMLAAYLPEVIVQTGAMIHGDLTDAQGKTNPTAETASGATVYMERLSDAQAFSMTFAQISWVLLPSNPAFSRKEIRDQVSSAKGYNYLSNKSPETAMEIAMAPNGAKIDYVKPWYHRSIGEHLMNAVGTVIKPLKPSNTETLIVNEQWRSLANKKVMKSMTTEQIIGLAQAPGEGMGKVVELSKLTSGLQDPAALRQFLKESGMKQREPNAEGFVITTPATKDPVDIRNIQVRDPVTKKWRLAVEGEARIVERPATKPGENTTPAVIEVYDAKAGKFVQVGTPGAMLARVENSGTGTQVRISNESISAAKAELEVRLTGRGFVRRTLDAIRGKEVLDGKPLRERILLGGEKVDLGNGVVLTGEPLANLKTTAALAHIETMPASRNPFRVAAEMTGRAWKSMFGEKLESQQVRQGRYLREETASEAQSIARSPQKRLEAVKEQVLELAGRVSDAGDKAAFEKVSKILSSGGAAKDVIRQATQELEAAAKTKTPESTGVVSETYTSLSRTLNGEVTADLVMLAARRRIDNKIANASGADAAALNIMRKALETDASRQVVIAHMLKAFGGHDALVGKIADAAGKKNETELDRAIDLYTAAWERAAFGQMAGERVIGKDGKLEWSIPAEREFKNRFNIAIAEFRPLQKRVIKETLGFIAQGETLIFGQMPTGGGKTLTNFTLIEFLEALAKKQGREGVIYLTTNPDLVSQAKEDYIAFFGKKPNFEVMTYGDLSARVAQAKEQGLPSPLAKHHLVGDEGDRPAAEVPTSVGLFNGGMSKSAIDPTQRVMQSAANRLVDGDLSFWAKVRTKHSLGEGQISKAQYEVLLKDADFRRGIETGEGGFYRMVALKYNLTGSIRDGEFYSLMRTNKEFAKDFNALVKSTNGEMNTAFRKLKSSEFRESIDLTKYPEYLALYEGNAGRARLELQKTMIAEYKHMVHTANLLHGSLSGRLQKFFKGGLEFASEPERSAKIIPDPDPSRGVINFNNGIAYDNLSTDVGPFGAAYFKRPISNEFESAGQLDFAGLLKEAVTHKAIFFLTSGTCATKIREIMIQRYGAKFTGETSIADPYKPRLVRSGADWISVKEKMEFVTSAKDGNNISVTYVNSLEESEAVFKAFAKVTDPSKISVLVRPGSALEEQERFREEIKFERNLGAYERGDAQIVIIVGAAGLRGLEMNLKKYVGKQSWMDIVAPERMDTDSKIQLIGRLSIGRAWMLNLRRFSSTTRLDDVAANPLVPRVLPEMVGLLHGAHGKGEMEAAAGLAGEIRVSEMFKGREYSPAELVNAIKTHEADTQRMFLEIQAWDKGPKDKPFKFTATPNDLYDNVILKMLKTPTELNAGAYTTQIVEILSLRKGTTEAEREAILNLPEGERAAALHKLLLDPAVLERPEVLDVLITSLGRREQDIAIGSSGILEAKGETGPKNITEWVGGKLIRPTLPPTIRTP